MSCKEQAELQEQKEYLVMFSWVSFKAFNTSECGSPDLELQQAHGSDRGETSRNTAAQHWFKCIGFDVTASKPSPNSLSALSPPAILSTFWNPISCNSEVATVRIFPLQVQAGA